MLPRHSLRSAAHIFSNFWVCFTASIVSSAATARIYIPSVTPAAITMIGATATIGALHAPSQTQMTMPEPLLFPEFLYGERSPTQRKMKAEAKKWGKRYAKSGDFPEPNLEQVGRERAEP